jgi:microcystin-dependent protein
MAQPYVGEIRIFAGDFAPAGWAICDGSILSISQYETLFELIGTTYGGDGQETFSLPDLRSRFPVHQGLAGGTNRVIGETGGSEQVTITTAQMAAHRHAPTASSVLGTSASPANAVWAASPDAPFSTVATGAPDVAMQANLLGPAGGNAAHENLPPYLAVTFIISLQGVFPSAS